MYTIILFQINIFEEIHTNFQTLLLHQQLKQKKKLVIYHHFTNSTILLGIKDQASMKKLKIMQENTGGWGVLITKSDFQTARGFYEKNGLIVRSFYAVIEGLDASSRQWDPVLAV